jgi:hypothetical protein
MDLVKNRASGKPFIVLDDTGDRYIELITPEGKVKRLERRLFGPLVPADHTDLKQHEDLTRAQVDKYMEYLRYVDY